MTVTGAFGELIETTIRVMTWNVWWRFGPWEERRAAIAATIAGVDADVVALQEVWGVEDGDFAGELADQLGFDHAYAWRLDLNGVRFGNALLSRWPIVRSEWRPLPAPATSEESRTVLFAEVGGPRGGVHVFSTHLNWRFDESHIRQDQVRAIAEFVSSTGERTFPPVLCGDFNATPTSDEIRMLTGRATVPVPHLVFHDAWEVAGKGPELTWSNDNLHARLDLEPDRRIDYIFVGWPKRGGVGHVQTCRVAGIEPVNGVVPSDHYAVVAELRY